MKYSNEACDVPLHADDTSVVRSLLSLLFTLTVQEKPILVLVLLNELARDIHLQLGDIDQVY